MSRRCWHQDCQLSFVPSPSSWQNLRLGSATNRAFQTGPLAFSKVLGLLVWTLIAGTEYFRVPAFGWGLCFNGSACALYFSAAIVDASSVSPEKEGHNFNSWAASSFFAFLVTICYAGNTYFSFIAWRSRTAQ
ncbi:CKLF-like MARVEL transmembrane domain-containing protein 8 isoform X3 [Rattus norvegicus]|uniref:CKLF-like MARVEL transmembrane domain-containing protein 8 isoform X3 n=1 Tax=Rattus norvegicus TaxID=10116 RepID=UPI002FD871C3